MSLEQNIGKEDQFRVSGGSEFQSREPVTENALLSSDDRSNRMERTSESKDLVETEFDGNEVVVVVLVVCLTTHQRHMGYIASEIDTWWEN